MTGAFASGQELSGLALSGQCGDRKGRPVGKPAAPEPPAGVLDALRHPAVRRIEPPFTLEWALLPR